jgi:hypothetical protein
VNSHFASQALAADHRRHMLSAAEEHRLAAAARTGRPTRAERRAARRRARQSAPQTRFPLGVHPALGQLGAADVWRRTAQNGR